MKGHPGWKAAPAADAKAAVPAAIAGAEAGATMAEADAAAGAGATRKLCIGWQCRRPDGCPAGVQGRDGSATKYNRKPREQRGFFLGLSTMGAEPGYRCR